MPKEDCRLIHFQYHGESGLSIPAKVEYFTHLEAWLDELCDRLEAGPKIRTQLQIAADEIFTNICSYAYPALSDGGTACIDCSFDTKAKTLILVFSDHGFAFNPLMQESVPVSGTRRKGGVGLLMVRRFADTLHYERRDGLNILTLEKRICEWGAE